MATRIIPKGIAAALVADSTVNGLINGRVYMRIAPVNVSYPYVVISLSAGISPNTEPGQTKSYSYIVRAVSSSQSIAAQVASGVYDALHHASLSLDNPWKFLQCDHVSEFEFVEEVEHEKVFHLGGIYRIRANQ